MSIDPDQMPEAPRYSVRSRLLMSHLMIALTGICLLLAALFLIQGISMKTKDIAMRYGPESEAYMRLLSGVQKSVAETLTVTLLLENTGARIGLSTWAEGVVPALERLKVLNVGDPDALLGLEDEVESLHRSLEATVTLVASPENVPAEVIYTEEIRPLLDGLKSTLLGARYEDPDPSESEGQHQIRLAELGYAWGATAVSEGALRDFLRFGTQAEEMLFRYWSAETLKSIQTLAVLAEGNVERRRAISTLLEDFQRYDTACGQAIKARKTPDWNRALYHFREETRPLATLVTERLHTLAFNRSAETTALAQALDKTTASSRTMLLLFGSFLALFGVWISSWQTVQITRPLIELAEASRELADEKFSRDLRVDRNDEIGFVVASFNAMRHSLRARRQEVEATQRALRASEAQYRLMAEVSPTPCVAIHGETLIYANPAFTELRLTEHGGATTTPGKNLTAVFGENVGGALKRYIEVIQQDPEAPGIEQLVHFSEKNVRYVEFRGAPIRIDGKDAVLFALHDVTERKKVERDLRRLNKTDALTEVANRRALDDHLEALWIAGCGEKTSLSFILVDIDFFKRYNDNYGHQAGDDCLRAVAKHLEQSIRAQGDDMLARYGGEEFAFLLPNTTVESACVVADRAIAKLGEANLPHEFSTVTDRVTVSMGICTVIPTHDVAMTTIIERADQALYLAKEQGRNRRVVAEAAEGPTAD